MWTTDQTQRFPWTPALVAFALSYGTYLLILNAVFWDDWTIVDVPSRVVLEKFRQAGSIFNFSGYLHTGLLHIGIWIYRPLILALMFGTGILVWAILGMEPWMRNLGRHVIAIVFLVLPLSASRVALIMMPATTAVFLFFLAWYIALRATTWRSRAIAMALFFLSFNLGALLVFYLLPWLHLAARTVRTRELGRWAKVGRLALFAAVPPIFWILRIAFFSPYGEYAGYAQVNREFLIDALPWMIGGAVYVGALFLWADRISRPKMLALLSLPAALWILWLGTVPFAAIGQSPVKFANWQAWYRFSFFDWNTRFQLLMPLGGALVIGALDRLTRIRNVPWLAIAVVVVSVLCNALVGLEYRLDWAKQIDLIAQWRASPEIRIARTITITDMAGDYNARRRGIRFYEWNGILKRAFGDETRFAMDSRAWGNPASGIIASSFFPAFTESNNAAGYHPGPLDLVVELRATAPRTQALWSGKPGILTIVRPAR